MRVTKRFWATLIMAAALFTVGAGCGEDDNASDGNSSNSGSGEKVAKEGLKIALLTPGTADDGSWGQGVSEGARQFGEKFGAEKVEIAENLDTPDQYQQQASAFASAGFDVVIFANGSVQTVAHRMAEQYPDTFFGEIAFEEGELPPNLAAVNGKWQNGTFLAGALAGLLTKTDQLGTVGGFDFPTLTSQMEGFALGARYVNPDAKIQRTYINTWTDTGKAKAAAEAQEARGADIVFSATDQATQGIFQLAKGGGKLDYVIAQYHDNCDQAPDVLLASILYNLEGLAGRFIEMAAKDEWKNEYTLYELDFGVGEIARCSGTESQIPDDVQKKVDDLSAQIKSGDLVIPEIEKLSKSGSSDAIDPQSLGG